jgi:HSP90 family molecular chaperone
METLTLNSDSGRLLDLVVHALDTERDVFLRELVDRQGMRPV